MCQQLIRRPVKNNSLHKGFRAFRRRNRENGKDAESHADEDKKFQEMVNAKNPVESLIHSTEKSLEELIDKVENEEAEVVKNAIEKLKASLEKEESDVIIADTQALAEAAGKIAESL